MTTDWSNTWAGANGWYDGYDSTNTGSFVDINSLSGAEKDAAIAAVRENIIGLLENKGVTRAQILDPTTDVGRFYQTQMDKASGGAANATRDAFQAAAQTTTSAVDRGDTWGADTDHTMGRTFLEKGVSDATTIADLYSKGFGRTEAEMAADTTGPQFWESKLGTTDEYGKTWTIQEIAKSFAESEEANIRDVYADEYGRDADAAGLQYWRDVSEGDDSDLVKRSVQYRGDAYEQAESSIRDAGWEYLGQASNEAQRKTMPTLGDNRLFTAMENKQVIDWVNKIQNKEMTIADLIKEPDKDDQGNVISGTGGILYNRGDYMDAHNQYDVDDWDEEKFPGGPPANPTGMGRFASLLEIQTAIDEGKSPDDVREELAGALWGALTQEKDKQFGEYGTSQDLYNPATKNFTSTYWAPDKTTHPGQGDWTPNVPTKPGVPGDMPVDRRQIEYMPNQQADQFSSTPYGAAKQEFDRVQSQVPAPAQPLATQQVGQRFTGTSAKGVRMKRSKASRMGTIRGTKQLGREQQTKSLNI